MDDLKTRLSALADREYAAFQAKLVPTIPAERILGVRVPILRKFADGFAKTAACEEFLHALPHETYDENLLHGILLTKTRPFDYCLALTEEFLPFVDNWAVCDTLRPRVFAANADRLFPHVRAWIASSEVYTCRFGIGMLMSYYLDGAFRPEYEELPARVTNEDYYVRMMVAWYFATALAKQWDATIPYLIGRRLPVWTHNMTIRKAVESFRVPEERKTYLKTLRIGTR